MVATKPKCLICEKTSRGEFTPLVNGKFIHDDCYEKLLNKRSELEKSIGNNQYAISENDREMKSIERFEAISEVGNYGRRGLVVGFKFIRTALIVTASLFSMSPAVVVADDSAAWVKAYDKDGRRYIPVALWNGGAWDGQHVITLPTVDLTFGRRDNKRIVGPRPWTHEASGTKHQIYERHNRRKVQYFAVNRKKDGLGRVYDNRYGRYCPDEVKFPLGWWKQGEKRVYEIDCDSGKRRIEVTINQLNFTHDGVPHSLEFRWKLGDGSQRGGDNVYTYSPGMGLVDVTQN